MHPINPELARTRRHFFRDCGVGLGSIALASLMERDASASSSANPIAPKRPHFEPKAKAVIFIFMAGGPSQLELFEPKPELNKLDGQLTPESFTKGKRFAFLKPGRQNPRLPAEIRAVRAIGDAA